MGPSSFHKRSGTVLQGGFDLGHLGFAFCFQVWHLVRSQARFSIGENQNRQNTGMHCTNVKRDGEGNKIAATRCRVNSPLTCCEVGA